MLQRAIAYYRVSTQRQGRSGLGIEAQRQVVDRFAQGEGFELIEHFTEIETGKGTDALERPLASLPHWRWRDANAVRSSSQSSTASRAMSHSSPV